MTFEEFKGDILNPPKDVNVIVIPTNMALRANGSGIMGAGLAKAARDKWPDLKLEFRLGEAIQDCGAAPECLAAESNARSFHLWVLHTKFTHFGKSDLQLIKNGFKTLLLENVTPGYRSRVKIAIPRLGCGLGGLSWGVVKPALESLYEDVETKVRLHNKDYQPDADAIKVAPEVIVIHKDA